MTSTYRVRWQISADSREQSVDYPSYALAEACFISLFSQVDRRADGWAELWEGDRMVIRLEGSHSSSAAAAPTPPLQPEANGGITE